MSREIPKAKKEEALRLWLQGRTYREIRDRMGVSVGAVNEIVAHARAVAPDLNELRELNTTLMREGSTVKDAMRGGRLLNGLGQLGVGLDEVGEFVELGERVTSEKRAEGEGLVDAALRLIRLERETGKAYGEVLKEFEERRSELAGLYLDRARLAKEVQGLKQELVRTVEGVSAKSQELKSLMSTKERLEKLGLEKVDRLSLFIEGYEKLGFSAEEAKKLSDWRKDLALMGVDPDGLGRFIEEKGLLGAQISRTRREAKEEGQKLDSMRGESRRMAKEVGSLQGRVSGLSRLGTVLEKRRALIPCKICGGEGVLIDVPSRPVAVNAVSTGLVWNAQCARCGRWAQYSAWDISAGVGLLALPES
jgi:hypothetical protein